MPTDLDAISLGTQMVRIMDHQMRQPKQTLFCRFEMLVLKLRHSADLPFSDKWNRGDLRRMVFVINEDAQLGVGYYVIRINKTNTDGLAHV